MIENPINPRPRADKQWICVLIKNNKVDMVEYSTLDWTRKESIHTFTTSKSGRPYAYTWRQLRKWGWRCVKVNISFEL